MLGASGFIVGTVTDFGEFLGYALRLVSGRWADRSRLYWPITLGGYIVQMVAVPALALSDTWPIAATLILLERIGRATRNPPRDVMTGSVHSTSQRPNSVATFSAVDLQYAREPGPRRAPGSPVQLKCARMVQYHAPIPRRARHRTFLTSRREPPGQL
jgi:hypothetical protein